MILSGIKKISDDVFPHFTRKICSHMNKGGDSGFKNFFFEKNNNRIILEGIDNFSSGFNKEGGLFAGIYSGIISFLKGKNIEAKPDYRNYPKKCRIILDSSFEKKYIPPPERVKLIKNYEGLNFPETSFLEKKVQTHKDFIKFKKIIIGKLGEYFFNSKLLIPFNQSGFGFIYDSFLEAGELDLFSKVIIKTAEDLAIHFFEGLSLSEKISLLEGMFSAFGQGVPMIRKKEGKIICTLLFPPIGKNSAHYHSFLLNGYLNNIFGRKLFLEEIKLMKSPVALNFVYS